MFSFSLFLLVSVFLVFFSFLIVIVWRAFSRGVIWENKDRYYNRNTEQKSSGHTCSSTPHQVGNNTVFQIKDTKTKKKKSSTYLFIYTFLSVSIVFIFIWINYDAFSCLVWVHYNNLDPNQYWLKLLLKVLWYVSKLISYMTTLPAVTNSKGPLNWVCVFWWYMLRGCTS